MAVLVVALPLITQVSMAQAVPAQKQEAQVVLPQGKELSDKELQKADGEGVITAVIGAVVQGGAEYAAQRLKHEKINVGVIVLNAGVGALAWGIGIPDATLKAVAASALRWTTRAAKAVGAAAGTKATLLGQKIAYGFNHYIGGPIVRFFKGK